MEILQEQINSYGIAFEEAAKEFLIEVYVQK